MELRATIPGSLAGLFGLVCRVQTAPVGTQTKRLTNCSAERDRDNIRSKTSCLQVQLLHLRSHTCRDRPRLMQQQTSCLQCSYLWPRCDSPHRKRIVEWEKYRLWWVKITLMPLRCFAILEDCLKSLPVQKCLSVPSSFLFEFFHSFSLILTAALFLLSSYIVVL